MQISGPGSSRVLRPRTVGEAVGLRSQAPEARLVGGGSLVVAERSRGVDSPAAYILLSGIPEIRGVQSGSAGLHVGAQTSLRDLHAATPGPMLDTALRSLATPQIRNHATVGGNIAERRPDHTLTPCLIALGATVRIEGSSGSTDVSIVDFLTRGVSSDELITAVVIPQVSGFQKYVRVARRNGPGYAVASVALAMDPTAQVVRTGLGAVGPTAVAAAKADAFLAGAVDWSAGTLAAGAAEEFGRMLGEACDPVTDDRATREYRRHAITVMGCRLVEDWAEEAAHGV